MDPTAAAIVAAGIPAFAAAVTFAIAEFLKYRQRRREELSSALSGFLQAMEVIPVVAMMPARERRKSLWLVDVNGTAFTLFAALPRRDRRLGWWALDRMTALSRARDIHELVSLGAETTSTVMAWTVSPRQRRSKMLDRLQTPFLEDVKAKTAAIEQSTPEGAR